MTCPVCAQTVDAAATACGRCGRAMSQDASGAVPVAAGAAVPRAHHILTARLMALLCVLALVLLLAYISVGAPGASGEAPRRVSLKQVTGGFREALRQPAESARAAAAPSASFGGTRVARVAVDSVVEIKSRAWYQWGWTARAKHSSCHVEGAVRVLAGGNKDVDVLVMRESELAGWREDHKARPVFESGRTGATTLDVSTSSAGRYVLVVSNDFSRRTAKTVQLKDVSVTCS